MGMYAFYTIPSIKLAQNTQFSANNESIVEVKFEFQDAFCCALNEWERHKKPISSIVGIMNQHNKLL